MNYNPNRLYFFSFRYIPLPSSEYYLSQTLNLLLGRKARRNIQTYKLNIFLVETVFTDLFIVFVFTAKRGREREKEESSIKLKSICCVVCFVFFSVIEWYRLYQQFYCNFVKMKCTHKWIGCYCKIPSNWNTSLRLKIRHTYIYIHMLKTKFHVKLHCMIFYDEYYTYHRYSHQKVYLKIYIIL